MTEITALSAISEKTIVSRNIAVMTAAVHDETVMMDIESGRYYGLDDIGSVIWQRLDTPQSFGTLIDGLAAEYDADREVIATDVGKLLTIMAKHALVSLG
jgi:Coenzyme PQQ synthesis protein D (PqqD)